MAQTSWPFENIDTTETQFSQWAKNINEGVKQGNGDELEITADGTGMTVSVGSGQHMIRGHYYSSTATESLAISASDPTNPRIDAVVLELDPTANTILLKVLTGTPDASPVAPTLTQTDAGIYQLALAYVQVDATVLAIESGDVTDKRGFMFSGIGKWTTDNRPTNPVQYETTGYNTTLNAHEFWNGTSWVGFADPITTEGDLIVGGASGVPERLPIGTDGQLLTVEDGTFAWADAAGGGGYTTYEVFTSSTSWTVPAGIEKCAVWVIGGGGGGGSGSVASQTSLFYITGGSGGAGSTLTYEPQYQLTPAESISVVVGAGGSGATAVSASNSTAWGLNGSSGSRSSFGDIVSGYGQYGYQGVAGSIANNAYVSANSSISGNWANEKLGFCQVPYTTGNTSEPSIPILSSSYGVSLLLFLNEGSKEPIQIQSQTPSVGSDGADNILSDTVGYLPGNAVDAGFCGGGGKGGGGRSTQTSNSTNGSDGISGGGGGGARARSTANDATAGSGGAGAVNSGAGGGGGGSAGVGGVELATSGAGGNGGSGLVVIWY